MHVIMKCKFGSHLYGTSTPQSDTDYKGVALPTWKQIALGRIPKHMEHSSTGIAHAKNTAEDVDTEIFSIHEFIKLASEGQTIALDMLHAPLSMLEECGSVWKDIILNRHKFYTNESHAFVGYARKQAAKYGVKGSRLSDAKRVLEWLHEQPVTARLHEVDSTFPVGEHIHKELSKGGITQYTVCGKSLQVTCTVGYCIPIVENYYKNYGDRARKAAMDEGIDWKAVSHAVRAAYQIKELLVHKTITFPRPEAKLLTDIKTGKLSYSTVGPLLDMLIDEVEVLAANSDLPDKPDTEFWEDFLLDVVENIRYFRYW